jgi:HK97 family phage prohead protease
MLKRLLAGEFRAYTEDGAEGVLVGVVSTYDSPYPIGGGYREQISRGAFDASMSENPTLPVYYQHNHLYGQTPIGVATRTVGEDGRLTVRAELFLEDSADARIVYRAAKAGALREWSVGMYYGGPDTGDSQFSRSDKLVTVTRADLREVSIVLKGANPDTEMLDVRSLDLVEEAPGEPPTASYPGTTEELAQLVRFII